MIKTNVDDILITLWNSVDQADYDRMVIKAFMNCPLKIKKQFISELLEARSLDCNQETIDIAKKVIETLKL